MSIIGLALLIAAFVIFVIAAIMGRSLVPAGLACWSLAEVVGRL